MNYQVDLEQPLETNKKHSMSYIEGNKINGNSTMTYNLKLHKNPGRQSNFTVRMNNFFNKITIDDLLQTTVIKLRSKRDSLQLNTKQSYFSNYSTQVLKPPILPIKATFACTVCYTEVKHDSIIKFNGTSHDICKPCYIEYLKTQINNNKV